MKKIKDEKVLRVIEERIVPQIPKEILHLLRYKLGSYYITRNNLKHISCSLQEFLDALVERIDGAKTFLFPFQGEGKPLSLLDGSLILRNKKKRGSRRILKIYSPMSGFDCTAETSFCSVLETFKDELNFVQAGRFVPFESLDMSSEVLAITKDNLFADTHIIIHYVPQKRS